MPTKKAKTADKKKKPVQKKAAKSTKSASSGKPIKLPNVMDISYSEEFFSQASDLANGKSKKITFDSSEVERITTPCVQILLSLDKTLGDGRELVLEKISEQMTQAFSDLGLEEQLNKWSSQ